MEVKPARTYSARLVDKVLLNGRDGSSAFKVYFLDIIGRDNPERYEWHVCGCTPKQFRARLVRQNLEGIGFVTAFPHITKVFRFDPEAEIVLLVQGYATREIEPVSLQRNEGFVEFACLAEALIAADEYRLWAEAGDVEAYLGSWSRFQTGDIREAGKLRRYWHRVEETV